MQIVANVTETHIVLAFHSRQKHFWQILVSSVFWHVQR